MRFLPLFILVTGLTLIIITIFPIGFSQLRYFFSLSPHLIDPTAVDFTRAQAWFTAPPALAAVSTPVKYFSLSLPRLGLIDVPVEVNGTDLKKNAILYSGTALPGTFGNSVILGHSSLPQLYRPGNPLTIFNPLPKAKVGDEVTINFDGTTYRYVIRQTREVRPEEVDVLAQRYDKKQLTLITCVPLGTYWRRFVATAELVN